MPYSSTARNRTTYVVECLWSEGQVTCGKRCNDVDRRTSLSSRAISSAVLGALVRSCRFTHRAVLNPSVLSVELFLLVSPVDEAVEVLEGTDSPVDTPSRRRKYLQGNIRSAHTAHKMLASQ